ncbi:GntR family transcriptional regulator [Carbonactinospora thermoautotrophica]|uniref:Transcriptional regulator n=1 Tax=Carbonactinospora thermoautotrophica TaxID=1469144 RepID=A0A132MUA9_9ACTN|nr:GntR family transcriptional regulator [Carbonactinospora thermoautotrophica]KWX01384.1 Transcriptional regulator [Carbonactinospora thermoautotrophica]KWX05678.1 GntR family transcriptional regulator [Carbonactinospora thermoautotrophica]KWX08134.1 GntR family transcriptional regulator [Carbonactinospora thermoautotrophica]MCX9192830.1 GntR family transcriptional regulator [Carbonactinospora thermoautotrophica]
MSQLSRAIRVDRTSPVPLYFQVAQALEQAIESGELPHGTRLENEIQLADQLGLSRPTMRRAIQYLVDKGLLVRKRGVGTQVVQARVKRSIELTSLYDDLAKSNQRPTTKVLRNEIEPASGQAAHALGVPEGTPVIALERLRYAGGEPLALLRNHLPTDLVELSTEALEEHGLYELLRAAGVHPRVASQTIGARAARTAEARLLNEAKGAPLLTMKRTTYADNGRAVEYGDHVYRASLYSFELTLVGH